MESRALRRSARPSRSDAGRGSRRRRNAPAFSYKEASSSEQESESESPAPASPKRRRVLEPRPASKPSTPRKQRPSGQRNPEPAIRLPQRERVKYHATPTIPSDGVIPDWQSLPYEILLSIFRCALHPAHDEDFRPNPSINWLLRASRVCKSFTEPALSALYEAPPLLYRDQPHGLLDLLAEESGYFAYGSKIRRLELDSKRTLAYSNPGRGHFDIAVLISQLPNLASIDISEPFDRPPYRLTTQKGRWHYPENLMPTLVERGTRLREWRWAGQMMGKNFPGLAHIHTLNPFQSLHHLSLSHLVLSPQIGGSKKLGGEILPDDLSVLAELQSLSIESCHSDDWELLKRLPNDLTSLVVVNCPSFDSTVLDPFLVEHGRKLKTLVLNHNHALDASWLVNLREACPKLETLRMDLTYFSSALLTQNIDSEPVFESLLRAEEVPSWPSTLRELEMLHLRKWSPEAAVTFFESLVNSSTELPALKYLTIKAMLNISWRDRAGFREKWIGLLRNTFLRISPPPSPNLVSFRAYRLFQEALEKQKIERQQKESSSQADSDRRVTRSAQYGDAEEGEQSESSHGTCEVVDINIDNMRPTENRLTEADFMDSEISGDEEWTGERSSPRASYAW